MRLNLRVRIVNINNNLRIIRSIYLFHVKIQSNRTFFHRFWPIFGIFGPIFIGFLAFSGNAQSVSGSTPYLVWVACGCIVWVITMSCLTNAQNMFTTKTRRRRFMAFGPPFICQVLGQFTLYFFVVFVFGLYVFVYTVTQIGLVSSIWKFVVLTLLLLMLFPTLLLITVCLSILSAALRDFKHIIPFIGNYLLFTSPIFYELPINRNGLIQFFSLINPITPILNMVRQVMLGESSILGFEVLIICLLAISSFIVINRYLTKFSIYMLSNL